MPDDEAPQSSIILFQTEDGRTRIECRFEAETIWLTQAQIAELFQTTPQNVTQHLKSIFVEGELSEGATCKESLQVRQEGGRDEFAELQALDRRPMTMRNWLEKLDEFLKISGRKLLEHVGKISAETARVKAEREYERYRVLVADAEQRRVDTYFEQAAKQVKKLPRGRKPKPPKP